jgi:hypothetical protein
LPVVLSHQEALAIIGRLAPPASLGKGHSIPSGTELFFEVTFIFPVGLFLKIPQGINPLGGTGVYPGFSLFKWGLRFFPQILKGHP